MKDFFNSFDDVIIKMVTKPSFIFFIYLIFCLFIVKGQQSVNDSLLTLLKESNHDTVKVNLLNSLSQNIRFSEPERSLEYASEAAETAKRINYKRGEAMALRNAAIVYRYKGNYPTAIEFLENSLRLFREMNDDEGISGCYTSIAINYGIQGQYSLGIDYLLKALSIEEKRGDLKGQANCNTNLTNMYVYQKDYDRALFHAEKAILQNKELDNPEGLSAILMNTGIIYSDLGNYEKALQYYMRALEIDEKKLSKKHISASYKNIATANRMLGYYEIALEYLKKSENLKLEIDDKPGLIKCYIEYGKLSAVKGDYKSSIDYGLKAQVMAQETNSGSDLSDIYFDLSNYFSNIKKTDIAFDYYKRHIALKDSLFNEEKTRETARAELSYDYDKRQEILKLEQEKKDEIAKVETKKQLLIRNVFVGGFLLMGLFSGLIFKGYREKLNANKIISAQKIKVEEQKLLVEEKNKDILDSIRYAKRIQEAVFPPPALIQRILPNSFIYFNPKDVVSGDFYWLNVADYEGRQNVFVAAVDCTGHGVPGALMSIVGSNGLNKAVNEENCTNPAEVLNSLNVTVNKTLRQSYEESKMRDGMDISLCCISENKIEKGKIDLQWAGANNPLWIITSSQNLVENEKAKYIMRDIDPGYDFFELRPDKQPIGTFIDEIVKPFTNHKLSLRKGDMIYLFSDGYADQFGGEKGKKFKYSQLKELLVKIYKLHVDEQHQILKETFEGWKGSLDQIDDVLVIGVRV
jgi:tetratricopeptide (TPR) repeat protein